MARMDGQLALVTGAGGGIGRAAAVALTKAGARVALTSRNPDRLDLAVQAVNAAGSTDVPTFVADFAHSSQVHDLARWAADDLGDLDVLVNNAGANSTTRSVTRIDDAALDYLIDVNVRAPTILARTLIPGMIERGGGTIVTVASFAVRNPGPLGGPTYAASKAAVSSLMKSINIEFRNERIRACTIYPGEVDTALLAQRPRPPTAEDRTTMIGAGDIAEAILFCASMPQRTLIEEIVVTPTVLRDTTEDIRIALQS